MEQRDQFEQQASAYCTPSYLAYLFAALLSAPVVYINQMNQYTKITIQNDPLGSLAATTSICNNIGIPIRDFIVTQLLNCLILAIFLVQISYFTDQQQQHQYARIQPESSSATTWWKNLLLVLLCFAVVIYTLISIVILLGKGNPICNQSLTYNIASGFQRGHPQRICYCRQNPTYTTGLSQLCKDSLASIQIGTDKMAFLAVACLLSYHLLWFILHKITRVSECCLVFAQVIIAVVVPVLAITRIPILNTQLPIYVLQSIGLEHSSYILLYAFDKLWVQHMSRFIVIYFLLSLAIPFLQLIYLALLQESHYDYLTQTYTLRIAFSQQKGIQDLKGLGVICLLVFQAIPLLLTLYMLSLAVRIICSKLSRMIFLIQQTIGSSTRTIELLAILMSPLIAITIVINNYDRAVYSTFSLFSLQGAKSQTQLWFSIISILAVLLKKLNNLYSQPSILCL